MNENRAVFFMLPRHVNQAVRTHEPVIHDFGDGYKRPWSPSVVRGQVISVIGRINIQNDPRRLLRLQWAVQVLEGFTTD